MSLRLTLRPALFVIAAFCIISEWTSLASAQDQPTNMVVIFCDDLGYGDLGCFGHPTISTPCLDQMAEEGMKCTQFYACASVCTPSRAGLVLGRLPIRTGLCGGRLVFRPHSTGGIQEEELTIAELFRNAGYATACVGKWHLGHLPPYMPTRHGFDSYYGILYSNDMDGGKPPLYRDEEIIEPIADQTTITERYTEEAIQFIEANKERPFFLYFPHTFPHVPLHPNEDFRGTSSRGKYGDIVEELDWSVGQVLDALKENGLAENTLVVFTSDNGPWLSRGVSGGSAGLLRDGKTTTWEGGMREPTIFWQPGTVEAGSVSQQVASTMDLFATACAMTGQELPTDRIYDSHDLTPMLLGEGPTTREAIFYYRGRRLCAIRVGEYKLHYAYSNRELESPELYNLEVDPSERHNIASRNRDIIEQIDAVRDAHLENLIAPPSQIENSNVERRDP